MYAHLGRVALSAGRVAQAAAGYLDECIHRCQTREWTRLKGYAHKDRSLVHLALGDAARAEQQAHRGRAVVQGPRVPGRNGPHQRVRGKFLQVLVATPRPNKCWPWPKRTSKAPGNGAEVARTQAEQAHVLQARAVPRSMVADTLLRALDSAERCRRHFLVRDIDAELRELDEGNPCPAHLSAPRGRAVSTDTVSLVSGRA